MMEKTRYNNNEYLDRISTRNSPKENKLNNKKSITPSTFSKYRKEIEDEYSSISTTGNIILEKKVSHKKLNRLLSNNNIPDFNKNENSEGSGLRKDHYGNTIKKGKNKKHRVTFIDEISEEKFINVVEIESIKDYNSEVFLANDKVTCNCVCLIY